jgi:hypothetical protein
MASVGPGRYVVVVLHVGGSKLADVKLVLPREPRSGKIWLPGVRVHLTKSMLMPPFASCMRKLTSF